MILAIENADDRRNAFPTAHLEFVLRNLLVIQTLVGLESEAQRSD